MDENKKAVEGGLPALQGSTEEYKVGPGNPPKEHRWKPGQSGNSNNRQADQGKDWPQKIRNQMKICTILSEPVQTALTH